MDDDTEDKDDTKRKSRNLSEKKRRDQFNLLVNELSSMVSTNNRKMDKSTVLKSTIAFLKNHNEITLRSRTHEIQENWKPSFLSNEEFTHLILEALDGFIMVFSSSGRIYYASESITSLLGHLPSDLLNMTIYEMAFEDDHTDIYNVLLNPNIVSDPIQSLNLDNQIMFSCHLKRGGLKFNEEVTYEVVQFIGYFRTDVDIDNMLPSTRSSSVNCSNNNSNYQPDADSKLIFVGTGRLQTPQLIREMSIIDSSKSEFTSRHSLEWKFLFLDHRAPPIIGYLPFEVLGTSGYDYYHFDDLEKVILCHESLMQKGEGTSCYYRFLTKGQQWIWLQTRFYITYHQWNSKPEFVVCTHRVVSYADVTRQLRNHNGSYVIIDNSGNSNKVGDGARSQEGRSMFLGNSNKVNGGEGSGANLDGETNNQGASDRGSEETQSRQKPASNSANLDSNLGMGVSDLEPSGNDKQQSMVPNSPWSSRSSKISRLAIASSPSMKSMRQRYHHYQEQGSDSATSMSADSHASRQSLLTHCSSKSRLRQNKSNSSTTTQPHHHQQQQHHSQHPHSYHQQGLTQQIPIHHSSALISHQHSPQNPVPNACPPQQIIQGPFLEPPQYLAAIPVQPVLAPGAFQATATVISPIQPTDIIPSSVVMTPAQSQIQDQLQRKHEELQHLIVQQQEELRRVSEQLLMARYGLLPPLVSTLPPFAATSTTNTNRIVSSMATISHHQQHLMTSSVIQVPPALHHQQSVHHAGISAPNQPTHLHQQHDQHSYHQIPIENPVQIGHHQLGPPPNEMIPYIQIDQQDATSCNYGSHEQHQQQIVNELETMPYQMSQEQAQILFASNLSSPNSTHQSQ